MMSSSKPEPRAVRISRLTALVCYVLFLALLALVTLHPLAHRWLASGARAEMTTATVPDRDPGRLARRASGIIGLE